MTKKIFPMNGIINELEGGASLFFKPQQDSPPPLSKPLLPSPEPTSVVLEEIEEKPTHGNGLSEHAMMLASTHASKRANNHASTRASNRASSPTSRQDSMDAIDKPHDFIKAIRKTVRRVGKDALYLRITPEEKRAVESIVHSVNELHRGEGFKTSENEIVRIALNYMLEDHQLNGNESVLARTLAALQA